MSEQPAAEELTLETLIQRVGGLVDELEAVPDDELRGQVFELLDLLESYHREGVTRLAMSIPPDVLEAAHEDPFVAHLLESYLGEAEDVDDPDQLVDEALEQIRPYVHSHGGEMELVGVDGGTVTLRLLGACDGCPSSSATLTQGVEAILRERWPGFRRLEVEGDPDHDHDHDHGHGGGQQLLQIQSLRHRDG